MQHARIAEQRRCFLTERLPEVAELAARAGANRLIAAMVTALVMVTALLLVASYVARQRRYEQDTLRGLRDRSEAGATLNAEVSGLNATLRTALPAEKG